MRVNADLGGGAGLLRDFWGVLFSEFEVLDFSNASMYGNLPQTWAQDMTGLQTLILDTNAVSAPRPSQQAAHHSACIPVCSYDPALQSGQQT